LLGIQRLARLFETTKNQGSLAEPLADYERHLFREITFLDWLVHGCYLTFGRIDLLSAYVMYYFAGAVESEARFRSGAAQSGFLFSDFEPFRSAVKRSHDALDGSDADAAATAGFAAELFARVASDIAGFNPAGFCDATKHNMYPFA
jgi:tetracycline 7-halogenase / FADH2 O2-dependent halogenase